MTYIPWFLKLSFFSNIHMLLDSIQVPYLALSTCTHFCTSTHITYIMKCNKHDHIDSYRDIQPEWVRCSLVGTQKRANHIYETGVMVVPSASFLIERGIGNFSRVSRPVYICPSGFWTDGKMYSQKDIMDFLCSERMTIEKEYSYIKVKDEMIRYLVDSMEWCESSPGKKMLYVYTLYLFQMYLRYPVPSAFPKYVRDAIWEAVVSSTHGLMTATQFVSYMQKKLDIR
jgi:hypothetical protein